MCYNQRMNNTTPGKLLRIYINEADKCKGRPVHEVLLERAEAKGLAGATVSKSLSGYGCRQTSKPGAKKNKPSCPLVIEIVDSEDNLDKFMDGLDKLLPEGLVTIQDVSIAIYKGEVSGGVR